MRIGIIGAGQISGEYRNNCNLGDRIESDQHWTESAIKKRRCADGNTQCDTEDDSDGESD